MLSKRRPSLGRLRGEAGGDHRPREISFSGDRAAQIFAELLAVFRGAPPGLEGAFI